MTLPSELRYRLLLELSQRISRTLDLQVLLDDLLHVLRSAVACDAAGVFVLSQAVPLARRTDPNLIAGMVQVGFDDPPLDDPMLRSGKGIVGHVIHTGEIVNAPDVRRDPRYVAGRAATRSELAVPIVSEAGTIGCLNVESDRPSFFTAADVELVQFFASAAALSIGKALLHRQVLEKQRLEDQLRVAHEVQAGLLPGAPPDLPGYDVAAVNLPTHAIGGDYYDYVPLDGGPPRARRGRRLGQGHPGGPHHGDVPGGAAHGDAPPGEPARRGRPAERRGARVPRRVPLRDRRLRRPRRGERRPHLRELRPQPAPAPARAGAAGRRCGAEAPPWASSRASDSGRARSAWSPATAWCSTPTASWSPRTPTSAEFGEERLEAAIRAVADRPASEALRSVIEATRAFSGRDRYDDDFTLVVVKRGAAAR